MKTTTLFTLLAGFSLSLQAGIVEPKVLWEKNQITTCFYDKESQLSLTRLKSRKDTLKDYNFKPRELSRREKKKVMETVLKDFTPERTGIHFVGWKDCSKTDNPDLIVMEAKGKVPFLTRPTFNGRAVIGEDGLAEQDEHGNFGFFQKTGLVSHLALYTQNKATVIHEFGHVAGLRHEHIHEDSINDKNCHKFGVTVDFENLEQPFVTTLFHTEYDSFSIMNYCYLQTQRNRIDREDKLILSQKDVETLQAYYQ